MAQTNHTSGEENTSQATRFKPLWRWYKVLEWLACHSRFVFHFTPTSASWLNAVEGVFALLSKRRLKRGVFRSLQELKDAIHRFIADTNANPKPFIWTKDPDRIIAAVRRGHQALDSVRISVTDHHHKSVTAEVWIE